jgi:uncharacterized membrane protein YkvI
MSAKTLMQIFIWPIVLGVLTMVGLVVTLLLEGGVLELISIGALGVPVIVMVYMYYFRDVIRH